MAITDINISEELQTNAPSIKYRGNQGPKSPQEQEQALLMRQLRAEYERYLAQANPNEVLSFQDWYRMSIEQQAKTRGPRAMAAYGGIMGVDGRRQYGFGSSLKSFVRKIIPNEVAKVAEVAAPITAVVAPQFALPAAIAGGLGSFDRTGSITSGLKSGALTYGLGALSPGLPGVRDMGPQSNIFTKQPFDGRYNISNLFKSKVPETPVTSKNTIGKDPIIEAISKGSDDIDEISSVVSERVKDIAKPKNTSGILKTVGDLMLDNKLITGLVAGTLGASAMMGNMEPEEIQDLQRGDGLDVEAIRKEVITAMKDPSGDALRAIRIKYPFLGKRDTKDLSGLAEGGRIGYANGVGPVLDVQEDDLSITDFMQDQGIPQGQMASMPSTFSELNQLSIDLFGRPYDKLNDSEQEILIEYFTKGKKQGGEGVMAAQGGRIGFSTGGDLMINPDKNNINYNDPRNMNTEDLILLIRNNRGTPEIFNELMLRDVKGVDSLMLDMIGGKKLDEPKEVFQVNEGLLKDYRVNQRSPIEGFLYDLRENNPETYGEYREPRQFMPIADNRANGGRIGKAVGGIMDLGGKEKDYRNTGGFVDLGAKEKADDVPARLSVNEFVMTADAVRGAGGGDIDKGAEIMENVMKNLEKGGRISEESQGLQGAREMFEVSERLSEVV